MDPLYEDETKNVSKLTAVATSVFSMNNVEHPGFPVRFIPEDQKAIKAQQILDNFNKENWLLHVDVTKLNGWKNIDTYENFHEKFNFPKVKPSTFHQLYELTASIHSLKKGLGVASHHRRLEVDDMDKESIETFKKYCTLLRSNLEDLCVKVKKFDSPPIGYLKKQEEGLLPPWPGKGYAITTKCFPHYKSDSQPGNRRQPVIFVLESSEKNLLGCSDVFKPVAAMTCYKCPSLNGGISACCHLGFLLICLSCPWFLTLNTINKPIRIVSIKNSKWLGILHPGEALRTKDNLRIGSVFKSNKRTSVIKRPNCPFNNPSIPFKKLRKSHPDRTVESEVSESITVEQSGRHKTLSVVESEASESTSVEAQESVGHKTLSLVESEESETLKSVSAMSCLSADSRQLTIDSSSAIEITSVSQMSQAQSLSAATDADSSSYYGRSGVDTSKKTYNKKVVDIPQKSSILGK